VRKRTKKVIKDAPITHDQYWAFCMTIIGHMIKSCNTHNERGMIMISYEPLRRTMAAKGFTTYTLRVTHGIGGGTVQRLQNNESISTNTLNDLCRILSCTLAEIAEYIEDEPDQTE